MTTNDDMPDIGEVLDLQANVGLAFLFGMAIAMLPAFYAWGVVDGVYAYLAFALTWLVLSLIFGFAGSLAAFKRFA